MAAAADVPAQIAGPEMATFIQPPVTVSSTLAEWQIGVLLKVTDATVTVDSLLGMRQRVY